MSLEEVDAKVELATTRYQQAKAEADARQEDLFATYADAARAGRTADELAKHGTFTAAYIRKKLRERGIQPRKGGPKPRRQERLPSWWETLSDDERTELLALESGDVLPGKYVHALTDAMGIGPMATRWASEPGDNWTFRVDSDLGQFLQEQRKATPGGDD